MTDHPAERYSDQIDATLRLLGSAIPAPGMEGRILVRLREAGGRHRALHFFSFPQFAVGMAATVVGGAIIVAGSVTHSRHMLPVAPGIQLPVAVQPGVGAASAAHVASRPIAALPEGRPRSVRKTVNGRAVISSTAKKHGGVVPKSPAEMQ